MTDVIGVRDIKDVLQSFIIEDVSKEQLTKDEQENLAERIKNILNKLK